MRGNGGHTGAPTAEKMALIVYTVQTTGTATINVTVTHPSSVWDGVNAYVVAGTSDPLTVLGSKLPVKNETWSPSPFVTAVTAGDFIALCVDPNVNYFNDSFSFTFNGSIA